MVCTCMLTRELRMILIVQEANFLSLCFIFYFFTITVFLYMYLKKKIIALIDDMSVNLKTVWNQSSCMHTHRRDILYPAAPQPVKRVAHFLCHLRYIIFARVNATSLFMLMFKTLEIRFQFKKISLFINITKYTYVSIW